MKIKLFVFFSRDNRSNDVRAWLSDPRLEIVSDPRKAKLIVSVGGDGTMLAAIHKFHQYNKSFLGVNRGTLGFLLNPAETIDDLLLAVNDYNLVTVRLLKIKYELSNGTKKECWSFNDFYFNAKHGTVCTGKIWGARYPEQTFKGDGLIISTAQGSTAYNYSAGGMTLPLGLVPKGGLMAVTTICASTPAIRDVVNEQKLTVEISRGPVVAFADSQKIPDLKKAEIELSPKTISLAFSKKYNFETHRYER